MRRVTLVWTSTLEQLKLNAEESADCEAPLGAQKGAPRLQQPRGALFWNAHARVVPRSTVKRAVLLQDLDSLRYNLLCQSVPRRHVDVVHHKSRVCV